MMGRLGHPPLPSRPPPGSSYSRERLMTSRATQRPGLVPRAWPQMSPRRTRLASVCPPNELERGPSRIPRHSKDVPCFARERLGELHSLIISRSVPGAAEGPGTRLARSSPPRRRRRRRSSLAAAAALRSTAAPRTFPLTSSSNGRPQSRPLDVIVAIVFFYFFPKPPGVGQ